MILIDGAFLTSIGIVSGNTASQTRYDFHYGLEMVNGQTVYNEYDFWKNSPVDGVYYNNQYEWFIAVGELHSEPIYSEYSFMQNVSFDGVNPVGNQYDYYRGVGALIGGGGVCTTPTSSFSSSTQSTITDTVITFTDTSTAGTFSVTSWAWDFGDGATSSVQNPTHSYSATGSYTVGLTASNSCGDGSYATETITVSEAPVSANIYYNRPALPTGDTVRRTYDVPWHIQNGGYDSYEQATASSFTIQNLDYSAGTASVYTLEHLNEFGNYARWTTATGYGAMDRENKVITDYIIDNLTGLAYVDVTGTQSTWNDYIDDTNTYEYYDVETGLTYSDFRPATITELQSTYDSNTTYWMQEGDGLPWAFHSGQGTAYAGFGANWTGESSENDPTNDAFRSESSVYQVRATAKTATLYTIAVRTHY